MIIGTLEDVVLRLDMRVNTLERRLQAALPPARSGREPESPDLGDLEDTIRSAPADMLEDTIRSLYVTIEELRVQLEDAKRTERDLDTEVARLTKENQRLTQLAWEAQAQVDKLLVEVKDLKQHNDDLARDAGSLIGARALNEALTQKQHMLEAKNNELVERLERHRDCIDRTADALELLGFQVFAPGVDICDNG
jgi:chromosome segregation ATPase